MGPRLALHATVDAGVAKDVRADSRLIQKVRQGENAEPPSSGAGPPAPSPDQSEIRANFRGKSRVYRGSSDAATAR